VNRVQVGDAAEHNAQGVAEDVVERMTSSPECVAVDGREQSSI